MRRLVAVLCLVPALTAPLGAEEPREILERAVKANGGAEALERCSSCRYSFKGKPIEEKVNINLEFTGEWQVGAPDRQKVRVVIAEPKMESILVFSKGKAWTLIDFMGNAPVVREMSDAEVGELRGLIHESHVRSLLPLLRDPKFTLKMAPEEKVKGRPAVGLEVAYPGKPDVIVHFDRETHLVVKTVYRGKSEQGAFVMETLYEDYRLPGADDEARLVKAGVKGDLASLRAYLAKQQFDPAALEKAQALVRSLGDESFEVREKAVRDLVALGPSARPALQQATRDDDLEVARRAQLCMERIQERAQTDTTRAAVRLLALRAPDEAPPVLLALLPSAEEPLAEEIKAVFVWLAERKGRPDPVLVRALDDADPVRRAAVRAALGKDGGAYLARPNRPLFLPTVPVAYRRSMCKDGKETLVFQLSNFRFVNRLDDKEFEKP